MRSGKEARKVLAELKQSVRKLEELADQAPSTAIFTAIETCKAARRVIKQMIAEFGEEHTRTPTHVDEPTIPRIADDSTAIEVAVAQESAGIPAARVDFEAAHADEAEDLPARVRDLAHAVVLLSAGSSAAAGMAARAVLAALDS